jgi:hypothetical protein
MNIILICSIIILILAIIYWIQSKDCCESYQNVNYTFIPSDLPIGKLTPYQEYISQIKIETNIEDAFNQCSRYNNGKIPQEVQDCPDSSFSFVNNIAEFVPNSSNYSGCIQLKYPSNNCYNTSSGQYKPNLSMLLAKST